MTRPGIELWSPGPLANTTHKANKVNKDFEYSKNECSMHGYLMKNIPAEQNIYFCIKKTPKKFRNSIPFP